MKYIIYQCGEPNTLSGGFGDRLMGIASCLSLCDKTNSNLLIKWDDFKLNEFFDYEKYDYYKYNIYGTTEKIVNHSVNELKQIFYKKRFHCDNLIINTNQNIWQFIHEFENLQKYEDYTHYLFKRIFEEILKPNKIIQNKIHNIINSNELIGIQLRFGDVFMNEEIKQIDTPQWSYQPLGNNIENNIENIKANIKALIDIIINKESGKKIFITSDINLNKIIDIKKLNNIIYIDETPVHIERSSNKNNMEKCFLDFLLLCKCNKLYITYKSNFGRIPAIIIKNNLFGIHNVENNLIIKDLTIKELACKLY